MIGAATRACLVLAAALVVSPTAARSQPLLGATGGGDQPLSIEADSALEWYEDLRIYVARGNAVLTQGESRLEAQTVTAHYREDADGASQIYRVIAEGGVEVSEGERLVRGDRLEYDLDTDTVVVTGDDLLLETGTETVTAKESLEYYQSDDVAVARGDVLVVSGTDTIAADLMVAEFAEGADGGQALTLLNAIGRVLITTESDIASGDEAVYNVADQFATLSGSVSLTSGDSQLNGDYAEIDLASGISRLVALPDAEGRVRALLAPEQADGAVESP